MRKKEILMPPGQKTRLAKAMGVTRQMVWKALTYESDTTLAKKIRYTARKEFGGLEAKNN